MTISQPTHCTAPSGKRGCPSEVLAWLPAVSWMARRGGSYAVQSTVHVRELHEYQIEAKSGLFVCVKARFTTLTPGSPLTHEVLGFSLFDLRGPSVSPFGWIGSTAAAIATRAKTHTKTLNICCERSKCESNVAGDVPLVATRTVSHCAG